MTELGYRSIRVYPDRKYRPRATDKVINWGSSTMPKWKATMKNEYFNIPFSTNKINTFTKLKEAGVPTVEWSTDWVEVANWDDIII